MTLTLLAAYKPAVMPCTAAPKFPWLWLLAAVPAAVLWTHFAVTNNNLELQSIDLAHHIMFVEHLKTPWGTSDAEFVGPYPLTSHRAATVFLPLLNNNPIQAIRASALLSLLVMFIAQWTLLRSQLTGCMAILVLVAWQTLCTHCKLGDVNHYMWDFQYNYSRGVSATALWLMIASFLVPPTKSCTFNYLFALGLAAFAFRCHLAAGALALGALGVWCMVNLIRKHWHLGIGGLLGLAATAAALLVFTDEWRYLASLSKDNGPMPVRYPETVDKVWIATAVIGVLVALGRSVRGIPNDLVTATLCALLPAVVLQSYMLYGIKVDESVGTYPYNQMLFYTFELSTLFWITVLLPKIACLPVFWLTRVLATGAAVWGLWTMLATDASRKSFGPERDVLHVIRELQENPELLKNRYYYDPDQEIGSYLVTRVIQGKASDKAAAYRLHIHQRQPQKLKEEPALHGVIMPKGVDGRAIFGDFTAFDESGGFQTATFVLNLLRGGC